MQAIAEQSIPSLMLDPLVRCFTPDVAARIASLRASPELQERIDYLADRHNEGGLSEEELREYSAFVETLDVIGLLQAKARAITGEDR